MELILWRHAEAEDPGPGGDFVRSLTKRGRKQADRMAAWLKPRLEGEWQLLVSPAARAMQTAAALEMDPDVRTKLDPSARADDILREADWPRADPDARQWRDNEQSVRPGRHSRRGHGSGR